MKTLSYVIFDGTSYYCVDYSDMMNLIKDSDCEVVFKHSSLDVCQDKADELTDEAYD